MKAQNSISNSNLLRAAIGFAAYLLLTPAFLFISAGTLDWPLAWVYVLMLLASTLVSRLIAWKRFPDLLRERASFIQAEGAKSWDRSLVVIVGLIGPMVTMVVAGLDQRFGWSVLTPVYGQYAAAVLVLAGYGLAVWAMSVNRFFSAVARIQKERGHVVVTAGPYRYLRHPSYAGALVASLALPFMLDAIWALIPALVMSAAIIIRTRLEDEMLRQELAGYSEYARGTPCRLMPGLW